MYNWTDLGRENNNTDVGEDSKLAYYFNSL